MGNDLNNGQLELVKGWWKPTLGTSDYFNKCNTGIVGVPNNFWGYQEAYHGDGYVGLCPVGWFISNGQITAQEYIQTKLVETLKSCKEYRLRFYVSCANFSQYAIGKIGAYLGEYEIDQHNDQVLDYTPQLENQMIISDTMDWVMIEGSYIASGKENYLTIGYFTNDFTNDTLEIQSFGTTDVAPYYYIDSVSIIEIGQANECNIPVPNIFTPNNDGLNDLIDFGYLSHFSNLDIRILNRWGNCIYNFDPNNTIWNGTTQTGEKCSDGIYYFLINFTVKGESYKKSGFIQLIR